MSDPARSSLHDDVLIWCASSDGVYDELAVDTVTPAAWPAKSRTGYRIELGELGQVQGRAGA